MAAALTIDFKGEINKFVGLVVKISTKEHTTRSEIIA